MIKKIFIQDEIVKNVKKGKYVDGSLYFNKETGELSFRAFNHSKRAKRPDILICETETGWLKESAQRLKFFSSVKKSLGNTRIHKIIKTDLDFAFENA